MLAWRRNPGQHYAIIPVPIAPPPPVVLADWELSATGKDNADEDYYLRDYYLASFLTIEQLAKKFGLSRKWVAHKLSAMGCNTSHTERRARIITQIKQAQQLGKPVEEISKDLGYTRQVIHNYIRRMNK